MKCNVSKTHTSELFYLIVFKYLHVYSWCWQDAQSYADDNSLLFMETSAKTSMNVNEIFMAIGG